MKTVRFSKEPGYTYDLFWTFVLNFNTEFCLKKVANQQKYEEDVAFFLKVVEDFQPISDDCLLFFYLNKEKRAFMTKYYYDPNLDDLVKGNCTVSDVLEKLLDYDRVVDNILEFYFEDQPKEVRDACKTSVAAANKLIRASNHSFRIKTALYDFLIDPESVIRHLYHELVIKEVQLSKLYEQNAERLLTLQNELDMDELIAGLVSLKTIAIDIRAYDTVTISWCQNCRTHLLTGSMGDAFFLVMGVEYKNLPKMLEGDWKIPDLQAVGLALSDENRVSILKMAQEKGEITQRDVEQVLPLARTNTYYHMSTIERAGLFKTRNRGRTMYFSINKPFFAKLANIFLEYAAPDEAETEETSEDGK